MSLFAFHSRGTHGTFSAWLSLRGEQGCDHHGKGDTQDPLPALMVDHELGQAYPREDQGLVGQQGRQQQQQHLEQQGCQQQQQVTEGRQVQEANHLLVQGHQDPPHLKRNLQAEDVQRADGEGGPSCTRPVLLQEGHELVECPQSWRANPRR